MLNDLENKIKKTIEELTNIRPESAKLMSTDDILIQLVFRVDYNLVFDDYM